MFEGGEFGELHFMMECIVCKIQNNNSVIFCDSCSRSVHRECSDLTSSELKVMDLKGKRSLKFYCDDCLNGLRSVPAILKKMDMMQVEMERLREQLTSPSSKSMADDTVISEIYERQRRANNVIVYNLQECNDSNSQVSDMSKVVELIKEITHEDLAVVKVFRIGKKNKNGARALKVVFSSADDALKVVKMRRNVKRERRVYIDADLTPSQVSYLQSLRKEVADRRQEGEDGLYIRYSAGVPKISKN